MSDVRLEIAFDTDNESKVESIIIILGEFLPYIVDNVVIREKV